MKAISILAMNKPATPPAGGIARKTGSSGNGSTGTTGSQAIGVGGLSLATGDILIVAFVFGEVTTDRTFTVTGDNSGAGTKVADLYANDSLDCNLCVGIFKQGATPDTTVTFGGLPTNVQPYAWSATVWTGVNQTTIQDVTATTATNINSSFPDPPAITPATAGARIVEVYAASRATASAWTTPSDVSNFNQQEALGLGRGRVAMADKAWTSGAFNAAALTGGTSGTSDCWCACALALRPA